ncbi:MAG TPA: SLC13 family permease [Planctomycetaceae bacterium]|nr:SLC13 family permease [Planctomycetaceae bacterium]HQZ65488.1 SLC13 family permease [Planctomycetaceae bacterium]
MKTDEPASDVMSESSCSGWVLPTLVAFSVSLLFLPTPAGMNPAAHRLVAVAFLMAGLWVTQAIPLAATSLLPLALFPLFGIQPAEETSKAFVEDVLFLYVGGMILALGIERWNLHRRIALNIISLVGVSPRRMVFGFGAAAFGLSMWISNTACTMLMLPIGLAMLKTLDDEDASGGEEARRSAPLAVPLLLMLAYASSLGGMATLVGTPTNSAAVGIYRNQLPDAPDVYFSQWFLSCVPISIAYASIVWFMLVRKLPFASSSDKDLATTLRKRLNAIGPITAPELRMLVVFSLTALLWVTREPLKFGSLQLFSGWYLHYGNIVAWISERLGSPPEVARVFLEKKFISDATIAIAMATLLFFLPSGTRDAQQRSLPLMDWKTAHRLPWDMILLFGGGFALASGFKATQLDKWLGATLESPLREVPGWMVIAILCLTLTMLTELTSNVATVNAIIPTVLALAEPLHMDPRMLFVPATLACSCSFMLPVGTPPNGIVFSTGRIPVRQMAVQGLWLNLIGIPILTVGTYLLIRPIMGIQ